MEKNPTLQYSKTPLNKAAERLGQVAATGGQRIGESSFNGWFGNLLFCGNGFEKRIAENPVCFCRSVKPPNAVIKGFFVN